MKCPICKKEFTDTKYRPFCSKRCADIDLGNWFNEVYRFEVTEIDEKDVEKMEAAINVDKPEDY